MMTVAGSAQTMKDVVSAMPDSILVYLTKNNRLDMIDFLDSKMPAVVDNSLGGKSEMTRLTDNFTEIKLSGSSLVQLKLLRRDTADVVCMVRTYLGEEPESTIAFYDSEWHPLPANITLPPVDDFFVKSDSLTDEKLEELKKMIDPVMMSMQLSPDDESVTVSLSQPLLNNDERDELKRNIVQKTINLNALLIK